MIFEIFKNQLVGFRVKAFCNPKNMKICIAYIEIISFKNNLSQYTIVRSL